MLPWCSVMNYKVIGTGHSTAESEDVLGLKMKPEFRRATEAMRMAYSSCVQALASVEKLNIEERAKISLIVGTTYGELEITKDFLKDFFLHKIARPTYFQNSLHNAILGFLSIHLNLHGPGVTISNGDKTQENLIEIAEMQLNSGEADLCLVCYVDTYMKKIFKEANQDASRLSVEEVCWAKLLASSKFQL